MEVFAINFDVVGIYRSVFLLNEMAFWTSFKTPER